MKAMPLEWIIVRLLLISLSPRPAFG